jgi:hypothetical protein
VITRYALVTDAIIAALQAAPGMVEVFDGAPTPGFDPYEAVYIGWSGGEDDETAGTISQEYHDTGIAAKRDETLSIDYVVQAVRGDDDMASARTRTVEILGIVETTLRATPALGIDGVLYVEVSAGSVRQVRNADGIGVEITGSITVTGII